MKFFRNKSTTTIIDDASDASLVIASLGGDRNAFGSIVTRYQRLLCSVAYSSLGNISESEDVAQEAFLEAWKKLDSLKEPEKLKAWLCGILRFKISRFRRKEAREPLRDAAELQEASALRSEDAGVEDLAIKEEEQALLWQALEKVPETYREPLILYYREHQSVEHVAYELDLTEDAVRQRLSRGRKVLQESMMRFVEGALAKSSPGSVFTAGVLAAMVSLAPPAKAAAVGGTAVQVGSWFKWATLAAFLATFSGVVSSAFALRAHFDQSRTKRERRYVVQVVALFFGLAIVLIAGIFGLRHLVMNGSLDAGYGMFAAQSLAIGFLLSYLFLCYRILKKVPELRAAERIRRPDLFADPGDEPDAKRRDYISAWSLFGVPLIHIKFGMAEKDEGPAVAWVAGGSRAYGLLFAWGGFAVAPVSVGIVSVGILSVGAVGIGIVGMGSVGVGLIGMGAVAFGYKAYSSLSSMGWESAFSPAFSIAREGAIGPIAQANEVNNELAAAITNLPMVGDIHGIVLAVTAVLVIVPAALYSNSVRRRMRKDKS